jgi:hypothetical protein
MGWVWHVVGMGEKSNVYSTFVERAEGKRPIGRPRRRQIDNIKMKLLEIGVDVWTRLAWLWIGTGEELM